LIKNAVSNSSQVTATVTYKNAFMSAATILLGKYK